MHPIKTLLLFLLVPALAFTQQVPDTTFHIDIAQAAYPFGKGPVVAIDAAHGNFHTADNRFRPFARLLEQDGYRVTSLTQALESVAALREVEILVISNPLHSSNADGNWTLPNPSAFTAAEIETIYQWVSGGGNLLLIADHMPFAGAAADLGKRFGFTFYNGFAQVRERSGPGGDVFTRTSGHLHAHPATDGLHTDERIDRLSTFTGSAFSAPESARAILSFPGGKVLLPDTAWQFHADTPAEPLDDKLQGATLQVGQGRVAVFGEAAMFTAQLAGQNAMRVGFNSEYAPRNARFVLNLMHWLDDVQAYSGPKAPDDAPTGVAAEILARNLGMESAFNSGNLRGVADFYATDAVIVGSGSEWHGRPAIADYFANVNNPIDWQLDNIEIIDYGQAVLQRGISRLKVRHEGREHISEVKFTLLWVREDGEWVIKVDHYSML